MGNFSPSLISLAVSVDVKHHVYLLKENRMHNRYSPHKRAECVWGEGQIIYVLLHCHHQNDSCIKVGSDESHFNVSVGSDGQSHKTVSTNHNLSEEKGEPKRYRTEVLSRTSLTPYRYAKPAHCCSLSCWESLIYHMLFSVRSCLTHPMLFLWHVYMLHSVSCGELLLHACALSFMCEFPIHSAYSFIWGVSVTFRPNITILVDWA